MEMNDRNCEILLEYLKSILYDQEIRKPDLDGMEEPFRRLGLCMESLQESVERTKAYVEALSMGNLSQEFPSGDSFLRGNLKKLQENLNTLTRQAKQVAAGDYSRQISCLGELSDAFNSMTGQLELRESQLKEETEKVKARAQVIKAYNELLVEVIRKRGEWVLVVDAEKRTVTYCNKADNWDREGTLQCDNRCTRKLHFQEQILNWTGERQRDWEFEDEQGNCYYVNSFPVEWRERHSYVHVISDVTRERQEKDVLQSKAYYDAAFGIRNRRFFLEYMEKALQESKTITLCYLDLDGLKFVNDRFGHLEGDNYIRGFVDIIQKHFRRGDILARVGGDEFILILEGNMGSLADDKLWNTRTCFREENRRPYPESFSYGIYVIDGEKNSSTLEEILGTADASMYEFKRKYKEERF